MTDGLNSTQKGALQPERSDLFRGQLAPLLMLTSIFFVNFLARIILAPLIPSIESDLTISHAAAGSFFLLISIGYFITLLCSGFISSRITHKRTIIFSSVGLGLALLLVSFTSSLWGMRFAMLILGMAAGPYIPSGIATLTTLIKSRHWGKAIAIHELAPNLSFVLAPLISEAVLYWFSWREVFLILGSIALLLAGIFARFGRGGDFHGEFANYKSYHNILAAPTFWIMVVLFSLGISSTMGIYTMLPLFLVAEHGLERNWANTLVALSRIVSVGVTLFGGWASDRFGPKRILRIVFLLTGMMTIIMGFAQSSWISIAVFLQPIMSVCFFPAGIAALSMVNSPKQRNIAVSLTVPIAFLVGGGATPTLIGFVGDVGSFGSGIALVGGAILTGAFFSGILKISDQSK